MDTPRRVRMFAGPNGSGKSSLVRRLAQEYNPKGMFHLYRFINADEILRLLQVGEGLRFSDFNLTVDEQRLRASLEAGKRLESNAHFLDAFQIVESILTAPAETCDAYVAPALADYLREELLALGLSFSFETVMSHPSKVEFFASSQGRISHVSLFHRHGEPKPKCPPCHESFRSWWRRCTAR